MDLTAAGLLEIWDVFADYVPSAKKNDIAIRFIKTLIDQDIEIEDLEELRGEDDHLDYALDSFASGVDLDEEYEFEE